MRAEGVGEGGCRWCGDRRDETEFGLRVWSGRVTDAYLSRRAIARGCVFVVWRGRHIAEPIDLSPIESDLYHREVLTVARAIRDCFRPPAIDYLTRGDRGAHLHTHVAVRRPDDTEAEARLLSEEIWRADAAALKVLLH
ncbi:hypothetical protein [Actinoplanes xinjiangensis]|uniref:Diadenosine tetraphosphate (Ap4A) HIT family hydrolase n=1 Tax=Actinoplanes xinjiangensis TaxID=512350 RepID=A0A316FQE5_9ACTN|nr:hypothetical protein [Actinoplanes xinjiangensis]PWK50998.1 diadenosine tetraphosphate (Ap4A) HIT family hydrolase [Actinoplanes xinjiangensis]GIF40022.1 hypothetical protein Axi01nite_43330 [Actinoplanes xinjiangensis]